MIDLQRQIIAEAIPLLDRSGTPDSVSPCSIAKPAENQQQAHGSPSGTGVHVTTSQTTLPNGYAR